MSSDVIQRRWRDALDAAAAAVVAGREAHELPAPVVTTKLRLLDEERRWLRAVRWTDFLF